MACLNHGDAAHKNVYKCTLDHSGGVVAPVDREIIAFQHVKVC